MWWSRWRNRFLCWRVLSSWAACELTASIWCESMRPSSGRTVSAQIRQMLSLHDVTSMLATDPLCHNHTPMFEQLIASSTETAMWYSPSLQLVSYRDPGMSNQSTITARSNSNSSNSPTVAPSCAHLPKSPAFQTDRETERRQDHQCGLKLPCQKQTFGLLLDNMIKLS